MYVYYIYVCIVYVCVIIYTIYSNNNHNNKITIKERIT